ncbi:amino acid permease [Sulfodiicoccus acidiphilus]|uniref:Amino acid permease n=1 Tax=Sulfodiicoccus acidiphilus TaxID=1670455 RepID=A0A348B6P7_9CREN|nr:APC family permease [Sulfodiicoccus acidiphilus]BBD73849.1 amino acid permease [Sulfodiicoccus acidiphilus]GGT96336.1 amino acid permease [Sulfodiicoccus acidiphilus]
METATEESHRDAPSPLRRELDFKDIFFLSLGGQAPFLSMLTYVTAVFTFSGSFSPIVMVVATGIVFVNGVVVYKLSTKYSSAGGYYTYAVHSLSKTLGLETGWIYLFYSVLYGAAYVAGSAFIVNFVLGVPTWIAISIPLIPSTIFLVMGVKPSTRYAIVAAAMELAVLVGIAIFALKLANFAFYVPDHPPTSPMLWLAILFGTGVPTGYGSITPVSGEVKNAKRTVGKAALAVILTGGLLMSLDAYGIADVAMRTGSLSSILASKIPIFEVLGRVLGPLTIPLLLFVAINDGVLATLAFMTASSRTMFAMGWDRTLPSFLGKVNGNKPLNAILVTIMVFAAVVVPSAFLLGPYGAFLALGAAAGLGGLTVHLSANFSLLRISTKRIEKRKVEMAVALAAVAVTAVTLGFSLTSTERVLADTFLGWVIGGFLYGETLRMRRKEEIKGEGGEIRRTNVSRNKNLGSKQRL